MHAHLHPTHVQVDETQIIQGEDAQFDSIRADLSALKQNFDACTRNVQYTKEVKNDHKNDKNNRHNGKGSNNSNGHGKISANSATESNSNNGKNSNGSHGKYNGGDGKGGERNGRGSNERQNHGVHVDGKSTGVAGMHAAKGAGMHAAEGAGMHSAEGAGMHVAEGLHSGEDRAHGDSVARNGVEVVEEGSGQIYNGNHGHGDSDQVDDDVVCDDDAEGGGAPGGDHKTQNHKNGAGGSVEPDFDIQEVFE
jgi:hypothetical protein